MNIKALALTALAASTIGFGVVPNAQAAGCYPSTATQKMEDYTAGGASFKQAWQWALSDGVVNNTERCRTQVVGYTRQMASIKPHLWRAMNK